MIEKGQIIFVEVTALAKFGVFVKKDDFSGLIHISEISDKYVKDIALFANVGDIVSAYILDVNEEEKKLVLSYKRCGNQRKIIVPELKIGFSSLEKQLPVWLKQNKEKLKDEENA